MMAASATATCARVRPQVREQPPHQARVVRLAEDLFVVNGAHDAASSSSSSCFLCEIRVEPVARDELVVRAALGDAAAVEHEDQVGVAHGRDAVRHDDRRPLAHDAAQPRQDLLFGVRVHGRQRVVQDQDPRVDGQGARERRPLLLAARQRDAALADDRVVAVREVGDVLVEARDGSTPSRSARAGRAVVAGRGRRPRTCPDGRPARTRRCRQACRRTGTAPAARTRSRRAASSSGSRGRRRRRRTPCRAADRAAARAG